MAKKSCVDTKIDIARLEERLNGIDDFIQEMKDNHLPHIYDGIESVKKEITVIEKQIAKYTGGLAALIILIQIVVNYLR